MVEPRPDPTSPDSWAAITGSDSGLPPPPIPPPPTPSSPWDNAPTPDAPEALTPPPAASPGYRSQTYGGRLLTPPPAASPLPSLSTPTGTSPWIPSTPHTQPTADRSPAGRRKVPGRALLIIAFVMLPGIFAWVVGILSSSERITSSEPVTPTAAPAKSTTAGNKPSSSSGPSFGPSTPVPATAEPVPSSIGPVKQALLEVWSSETVDDLYVSLATRNEEATSYLRLAQQATPFAAHLDVPNDVRSVTVIARDNRLNEGKALLRCRISANGHPIVETLGQHRALCSADLDEVS